MDYIEKHLAETVHVLQSLDKNQILSVVAELQELRSQKGRLFILGVGGSAANASHAVNDFRKLSDIEAYAPTDNVSELTARTNDEGWSSVFSSWLEGSRLSRKDAILVLSVGGGNKEKNVSPNLVEAIDYAKTVGARVLGIVGRDGGYTRVHADASVLIPTASKENITPHSESMQSVLLHLLVSHPAIKVSLTKWEQVV